MANFGHLPTMSVYYYRHVIISDVSDTTVCVYKLESRSCRSYIFTLLYKISRFIPRELGKEGTCLLSSISTSFFSAITFNDFSISAAHNLIVPQFPLVQKTLYLLQGHLTLGICHLFGALNLQMFSDYKLLFFQLAYVLNLSKPPLYCHFKFIHSTNIYYLCQALNLELGVQ